LSRWASGRRIGVMLSSSCVAIAFLSTVSFAAPAPVISAVHPTEMSAEQVEAELHTDLAKERRLVVAGGTIAGAGLVTATLGFGVLAGIHAGNPGPGMTLEHDDPVAAKRVLRTANAMMGVGLAGASMLLTGAVIVAIAGISRRRARSPRSSRVFGASPGGLAISF